MSKAEESRSEVSCPKVIKAEVNEPEVGKAAVSAPELSGGEVRRRNRARPRAAERNKSARCQQMEAVWTNREGVKADQEEFLFKVVILGESGVGKSSLARRLTGQATLLHHTPTIGLDFSLCTFLVDGNWVNAYIQI